MTPFTCWKTACTPQKHPPAKTAVSWPLFAARDSFAAWDRAEPPLFRPRLQTSQLKATQPETNRLKRDFDITFLPRTSFPRIFHYVRVASPAKVPVNRERDRLTNGQRELTLNVRTEPSHRIARPRRRRLQALPGVARRSGAGNAFAWLAAYLAKSGNFIHILYLNATPELLKQTLKLCVLHYVMKKSLSDTDRVPRFWTVLLVARLGTEPGRR